MTATETTQATYPRQVEDAHPDSQIGQLYRKWRQTLEKPSPVVRARDLEQELQRHEAVIRDARPGCDWAQVAASKAAVDLLPQFIREAREENSRALIDDSYAEERCMVEWQRYVRIRDEVEALERKERSYVSTEFKDWLMTYGRTREPSLDELRKEIRQLVGPPS